jgi:hypothetical protein
MTRLTRPTSSPRSITSWIKAMRLQRDESQGADINRRLRELLAMEKDPSVRKPK